MNASRGVTAKQILLVEDCDEDFETVGDALRSTGRSHELIRAINGDDCLEILKISVQGGILPCLLLLDLNTPGNDGRDVLRVIKSEPQFEALPVVVLTSSTNPRDTEDCLKHGASAYLVKPFHYPEFLVLLERIFTQWLDDHITAEQQL